MKLTNTAFRWLMLSVASATVLAACGGSPPAAESPLASPTMEAQPTDTATPPMVAQPTDTATPPTPTTEIQADQATTRPAVPVPTASAAGPRAEMMAATARADLALRLGVPEEEIAVKSVEAVEWSDTSLGCPQPGMMYAQVITPGHQILLQARGEMYDYRSAGGRLLVLCEQD